MLNEITNDEVLDRLQKSLSKGNQPNLSYCIWCNDKLSNDIEKDFIIKILDKFKIEFSDKATSDQYCCRSMEQSLIDPTDPVYYNSVFREHYIKTYREYNTLVLTYCPWCGVNLSQSLRSKFFDIIFDELDLDGPDDPNLPQEFKSDEWWKKRGL